MPEIIVQFPEDIRVLEGDELHIYFDTMISDDTEIDPETVRAWTEDEFEDQIELPDPDYMELK